MKKFKTVIKLKLEKTRMQEELLNKAKFLKNIDFHLVQMNSGQPDQAR